MRGVIKGVLAEELKNSLSLQKDYEALLKKLPQGCLVEKNIRGNKYYYIVKREGKKLINRYCGKLPLKEVNKYKEAKDLRAKYRNALSKLKKQIKYLRGALRGKEPI